MLFSICLLSLLGSAPTNAQDAKDDDGFKSIFNGESLEGWRGDEKLWRVEDGCIVGETTPENVLKSNQFLVWDQGEVDDFVLKLKFKVTGTGSANSGVQIRSTQDKSGAMIGYQPDIDRSGRYLGIIYSEKTGRGILAQRGEKVTIRGAKDKDIEKFGDAAEILKGVDMDDWIDMEITAQGNHIVVKVNDKVTAELIDEDPEKMVPSGLLGLQIHVGPPMKIEFKDIRLKRLVLEGGN
jgi:hypothetical protein